MGKRIKKKRQLPKNMKVQEAEQRTRFFKNIHRLLKLYGCEDLFHQFDETEKDFLFKARLQYPKLKPAPGHHVSVKLLRAMKDTLYYQFNETKVDVKPNGASISLMEYYTLQCSLYVLYYWLKEKEEPEKYKKADILSEYIDFEELAERADKKGSYKTFVVILVFSEFEDHLYWVNVKYDSCPSDKIVHCLSLEVHATKPEVISYTIDGNKRPLYRVGWAYSNEGVYWSSIKPDVLQMKGHCSEIPLPVYIQAHAIRRLEERIDCLCSPFLQFQLYDSLKNPVFINFEGRMLIEYQINDIKYGYLLVEYFEGFVLVKTFLFLTNNGTPEGRKLHEISGLNKLDKQYWAIDKLSTFFTPDFVNNENLKALFAEAGCEKLFEPLNINFELKESAGVADKILQFIEKAKINHPCQEVEG
ncbi:MAG: hypothetical protein JXB49_21805 [Bacteroidales bacterium]|nr:hypothetical protein [Bacteroidales bacterium]